MSIPRALALQERSWALHAAGQLAAAAATCREAIHLIDEADESGALDLANLLNDLAEIERDRGRPAEAVVVADRARRIGFPAHAAPDVVVRIRFKTLTLTGSLRRALGALPAEAWADLREAETLAAAAFGEPSEEVAIARNELGLLCKALGRLEEGSRFYAQALASMIAIHGDGSVAAGAILHNIGGLLHARGDVHAAESPSRRAWAISCQHLGRDHPQTMADAVAYAAVLDGLGRHEESERLCRDALAVFERAYGPDHEEVAATLHNLAAAVEHRGDTREAEACCRRALAIYEERFGSDNLDAAWTRNNLGKLLIDAGRDEGRVLLHQSLFVLEARLPASHPQLARVRANTDAATLAQRQAVSDRWFDRVRQRFERDEEVPVRAQALRLAHRRERWSSSCAAASMDATNSRSIDLAQGSGAGLWSRGGGVMASRTIPALALVGLLSSPAALNSAPSAAGGAMSEAASALLADLSAEQRSKASFAFDHDSRFEFRYTPRARTGLPLKEMTEAQRAKAHTLLKTGLSMRGYTTATTIVGLENVLKAIEPPRTGPNAIVRDPELYFVSIFGTPGKSPWGWKFEGHHVSVNFTLVDNAPAVFAPSFFGANPAIVRDGPSKGTRALRAEEEAGRALMAAFTDEQRKKVIFDVTAPREMVTAENREASPLPPGGITASEMTPAQRRLLEQLLDVYLGRIAEDVAKARLEALQKAGFEKVTFGWAGTLDVGGPHYYRVQGPTFLVEYDNTQNDANHIHSVWRDFKGDFGRDLLSEHLRELPH